MPRTNANIRIVVGASLDRDAQSVLSPLVAAVQSARTKIEAEFKRVSKGVAGEMHKAARGAAAAYAGMAKDVGASAAGMVGPYHEASARLAKDAREHTGAVRRDYARLTHAVEQEFARIRKAEQSAFGGGGDGGGPLGGGGGSGPRSGRRRRGAGGSDSIAGVGTGLNVVGAAYATRAALRFATRTAADIAEGAGVDLDLSSHVRKNAELETRTVNLSNQAYIEGAPGAAGTRQAPQALAAEVRHVALATGFDTTTAVEGLERFVGKTGDLETGRKIFTAMAVLAKATGSSLTDMHDAAADVSNVLGDMPNKAAVIKDVMKSVTAQGKIGAVEIRDLASQMAKVAASAGQIEGDPGKNIKTLAALAQAARAEGGAANAYQATTAVQSFVNILKTPARAKAFEAATHKSIYTNEGMIRDPEELIVEALRATGMKPLAFKNIFANVKGAQPAEAMATIYRRAGGGEEGERQVREAFARFAQAALDDRDILESFQRAMSTSESEATKFNNQLQSVVAEMQTALLPAFVAMAPSVLAATKAMADLVTMIFGVKVNETTDPAYSGADRAERDVRFTKSQTDRGFIDPRQIEKNERDEKELRRSIEVERGSIDVDKKEHFSKGPLGLIKDFYVGTVAGAITEHRLDGGMRYLENQADSLATREKLLKSDQERLQNLSIENARVAELLKSGVINVRVVSGPTPPPGADRSAVGKPESHVGGN